MALLAAERAAEQDKRGLSPGRMADRRGSGSGPKDVNEVESLFICFKPTAKKLSAFSSHSALWAVGFEYRYHENDIRRRFSVIR